MGFGVLSLLLKLFLARERLGLVRVRQRLRGLVRGLVGGRGLAEG